MFFTFVLFDPTFVFGCKQSMSNGLLCVCVAQRDGRGRVQARLRAQDTHERRLALLFKEEEGLGETLLGRLAFRRVQMEQLHAERTIPWPVVVTF